MSRGNRKSVVIREVTRPRRRRRGNRRNNRTTSTVTTVVNKNLSPNGPPTQAIVGRRRRRRQTIGAPQGRLTDAGMQFLKAAFAPPDFSIDPGMGIPDNYNGMTLTIKDCYTDALTFSPGKDTYIIVAPVPGYSYFKAEVNAGATPKTFTGVPFPTYTSNFGDSTPASGAVDSFNLQNNNYASFRYSSLAAGLYPTSNYMNFSGSVSVWKADIELADMTAQAVTAISGTAATKGNFIKKRLAGAQSIHHQVPRDNFSESFIRGCYTMSTDKTGLFEWTDFVYAPEFSSTGTTGDEKYRQIIAKDASTALPGFGNMETIIIKVSTPAGSTTSPVTNSALLKLWNSMELKPRTDTPLYQFSSVSPKHDPLAIEYYNCIKNRLPVAVAASENAWSWERVLKIMREVGLAIGMVPGPIGMVGSGVATLAQGISGIVL